MKPIGQKTGAEQIASRKLHKTEAKDGNAAAKSGAVQADTYDVKLSEAGKKRAEALKTAFEAAKNSPDVREDLVAKYKALIASGEYKPEAGDIADGLMREAVREELAGRE